MKGNNTSVLDIHDVTVAYRRQPVLWDVDWTLQEPALVAIVGPNGAGKSTLLKAILGLVPLVTGSVRIFGETVERVRQRLAYVPQRESVDWDFPATVFDVVLMGTYGKLGWLRRPGPSERQIARECLARLGLGGLEDRPIGDLSGGQQQRVFLARALAQRADLYLMDEPLAGVDAATERIVFSLLQELRQQGRTSIVVHHDLRTVPEWFEQVVLLNTRIIASGPVHDVFTPENLSKTYGGRLVILEEAGRLVPGGPRSAP